VNAAVSLPEIPELETPRLRLRANRPEDFEAYAAFYASDRARLRGGPKGRYEAWIQFSAEIGHWAVRGYGFWAVEETATGAYCGQVGLWNPEGWPEPEVGWLVWAEHEGRGIAREAAEAARDHAFGALGWTRLASCISPGNDRSAALARRLGARLDRIAPGPTGRPMEVWLHPTPEERAA
jgi:RimJ/RimL family protein N-acetyltransferase